MEWVVLSQEKHVLRRRFFSCSRRASRKRKIGVKSRSFPLARPLTTPPLGLGLTCISAAAQEQPSP